MWNNTLHVWHDLPDATSLASALSQAMQRDVLQALSLQSTVLIGLAGGSTPMAAYSGLAQANLPWSQLQFVLIDERFVPTTDPQSNEGNISKAFTPIKNQLGAWLGLFHFADTIEQAAAYSNAEVKKLGDEMDFVVVGMGTDGHIASLFIESKDYIQAMTVDSVQSVVPIRFAPDEQKIDRLSFTLAELLKAKKMLICITGDEKRAVLESVILGNKPDYAISHLLKHYTNQIEIFWSPT